MPYADPEQRRAYIAEYHRKNPGKRRSYEKANRKQAAAVRRKSYRKQIEAIRARLFAALGERCNRCGFADVRALQFHHTNRDGNEVRRAGLRHIAYLKHLEELATAGSGLEVLCANCHTIEHYDDQRKDNLPVPEARKDRSVMQYARSLTPEQVREIRRRRSSGELLASIAADFPVRESMISNIARGKAYQWVQ